MNWQSLEVWSDIVGVCSAAAMAVPAWKADSTAAFMSAFRAALAQPRQGGDPNSLPVSEDLERRAAAWKAPDRWLLRLGVALLALSFLMKMAHHAGYKL
ncbi:MAG: hypothetical protein GXC94_08395 [Comamonadaceae bacterium]|nr:hypothetical protein [Comamonadaceae bacterium]